ncbi:30S ribosomal protein S16 [Weeksellaceae bacterium TAE3-ERU29]|nr:30S ribosomal protein S16 [Weeksellaceae bacterium TAE3-ERU29]
MAVKIRLQRHGRKGRPFYHVVVADSRVKRDGKVIERLGSYNPITNPATIELDVDKAVEWLQKGAQPTNTARTILSHQGALLKKHLLGGVAKGAFDEAEAEKRFTAWVEEKEGKINAKKENLTKAQEEERKAKLEAERKIAEARLAEAAAEETEAEEPQTEEEATEETPSEE